jgi:hypothetical protein
MTDKQTLLELIDILKEIREDAKTVAQLTAKVNLLVWAMGGIYAAFWGYILFAVILMK